MIQQDKSILEAIFKAHYSALCQTAFRIVRDRELAEDIVQDVFCRLWGSNQTLALRDGILAYLHKIVINQSLNSLRGQKNRSVRENDFGIAVYEEKNFTEELLLLKDLKTKVDRIIDMLPPACRMVFVLSRYENLKYKEIASQLNISVKTVENQMIKALKHVRKHLGVVLFVFFMIYF